ncbi:MAG TPA: hypothetical protein VD735_01030, partial [Candidatus Saccharimonadales bacterium]|nr:hypothetical protein [Candidatus Saccharimonadales bacterium]
MIRSEILPDGRLASCLHDETTVMFMGEVARIERAGSAPEAAVAAKALGACILSECPLITFQQECPSPFQRRFDQLKDYVDAHRPPRVAPEMFAETIVLPDVHNETQVDTFLNQVAELTYLQIEQARPHWYRTGMMRQPGLCAKTTAIMCHNLGRWGVESEPMYHPFPESHFYVRT